MSFCKPLVQARFGAAWLLLATSFVAARATASEGYPEIMRAEVQAPIGPACTHCHETAEGGFATSNTPFGITTRRLGLIGQSARSARQMVEILRNEGARADSDGDGISDYDELKAGTDPNVPTADDDTTLPEYGCNRIAPTVPQRSGAGWAWPLVGLALLAWRRLQSR